MGRKFDEDDDDILELEDRDDDDDEGIDPGGGSGPLAGRPGAPETEEQRESRAEKRRNRGKLFEALQVTQQENSQLRERMARLEGQHEVTNRQQQQNQPNEYQVGLGQFLQRDRQLREHGESLLEAARRDNKPVDKEKWKQLDDALLLNDVARQEYIADHAAARRSREVADPRRVSAELVHQRFQDVSSNPQAIAWANGRYTQLRAEGAPDSEATLEKALTAARERFGTGGGRRGDVPDGDRRRSMGVRGGGGGSFGTPDGERPRQSAKLDRPTQRIAEAMYPNMKPEQAHRTWWKNIGSKNED